MAAVEAPEQQFILRVADAGLADKLRRWLRADSVDDAVQLLFPDSDAHGTLVADGVTYPVTAQNLPALVESYKTLDDTNLVKTADIGQVLVVGAPGSEPLQGDECPDGVTPFMREARGRHFRPRFTLTNPQVAAAEHALLEVASGRAPEGWTFHDVEEEYVVDRATGEGRWQQVAKAKRPAQGGGKKGGGGSQRPRLSDSE